MLLPGDTITTITTASASATMLELELYRCGICMQYLTLRPGKGRGKGTECSRQAGKSTLSQSALSSVFWPSVRVSSQLTVSNVRQSEQQQWQQLMSVMEKTTCTCCLSTTTTTYHR